MAETIGLASGLLTLSTFALHSSVVLYDAVKSFRFHPKRVRDLTEELEALSGVLRTLTSTVNTTADGTLSALELPLLRCGNACKEFEEELLKCSSRSGADRTSFRDWAKLRYMGDDIDGFRQLLAGYKSTISIALTDAALRHSSATAESLERYRELIRTATDDLEAHLQGIDDKLEIAISGTVTDSASDSKELSRIKDERLSTEKCLQICAQLSDHIDQIQFRPSQQDGSSSEARTGVSVPERVISEGLQQCRNSLHETSARLEKHMFDLIDRLTMGSKTALTSEEEVTDLRRLREEWKTARQCIDICSRADTHLQDNISVIDNYATGDDAIQYLVSTNGKTIHGKNTGYGWRTRQVGGHLSDASIQQISRDTSSLVTRSLETKTATLHTSDDTTESTPGPDFDKRYGRGSTLASNSCPSVARTRSAKESRDKNTTTF